MTAMYRLLGRGSGVLHRLTLNSKTAAFGISDSLNNRLIPVSCFNNLDRSFSSQTLETVQADLPLECKVVICGGGAIGCSVAYHLAKQGWSDIVLLEQGSLTCGTTWHSVGLIGRLRESATETAICKYSAELYKELEAEGYATGWKECGSINIARTKDRMIAYKRALINAERIGVHGEIISPEEIKRLCPMLKVDDVEGAIWLPEDGSTSAPDVALALSRKAKEMGVKFYQKVRVEEVLTENDSVKAVKTNQGSIMCQYFVNCAGQWARTLGLKSTPAVRVPLHPCEHFYIVTKPIADQPVDRMMPVIRDYDGYIYLREWSGGLLGGGFEPQGKPVFHDGIPDNFEFQLLPEDWDHFQVILEQLLHRVPMMEGAEVQQMVNGPESFTPDGKYIIGESPDVKNYFVAAGMNSSGIAAAGGVGKLLSEWLVNGKPSSFVWSMDIRRFVPLHNNKKFLKERVKETLGMECKIWTWDRDDMMRTSRNVRFSPLYPRMEDHAAVFGQVMGYERTLYLTKVLDGEGLGKEQDDDDTWYYDRSSRMGSHRDDPSSGHGDYYEVESQSSSFGKPDWFDKVKSEYWVCREGVCLIDMSTFSKFELQSAGTEVVDFLQYVCSNDVDRPVGTVIHTGMQNHSGGYENDCSMVRLDNNKYFMIGPTAQQTRAFAWLNEHKPIDGSVQINDVTSMYTAINVIGPKAQELLQELTDAGLQKHEFAHMTCQEINVGQASGIKAMRLTHSGEDGWMLYIPSEYALHVYDSLMSEGKNYGIRNAGYYALRALRTEKFFAYWGTDLTPFTTPMECGREFRVKLDKGGFIGHEALLRQKKEGIRKQLVQFLLVGHHVDEDLWPWGGEPIYRNGQFCGTTTSTAYGFTLDRHVCLGYVHNYSAEGEEQLITPDYITKNATFELDICGKRFQAKANIYPPKLPSAAVVINTDTRRVKPDL